MARQFNGTSNCILGTPAFTGLPLTFACWFNPPNTTSGRCLISLGATATDNNFSMMALGQFAGDPIYAQTIASGTAVGVSSTTGYTANAWHHAAAVFASTTSRSAYCNGGGKASIATANAPSAMNSVCIGAWRRPTLDAYSDASIAEAGIWNVALTDDEIASLAKGVSPRLVRPASLVLYAPLIRDVMDVRGGIALTENGGTTTTFDHPRILL